MTDEKTHRLISWIHNESNGHSKDKELAGEAVIENERSLLAILRLADEDKAVCESLNLHRLVKRSLRKHWQKWEAAEQQNERNKLRALPKNEKGFADAGALVKHCLHILHPDYHESKPEAVELLIVGAMQSLTKSNANGSTRAIAGNTAKRSKRHTTPLQKAVIKAIKQGLEGARLWQWIDLEAGQNTQIKPLPSWEPWPGSFAKAYNRALKRQLNTFVFRVRRSLGHLSD